MKKALKIIGGTVGILLIVLLLFLGSLFFREQKLPAFLVERLEEALSTEMMRFSVARASFGFRHGLRLQRVRIHDLTHPDALERPIGSARTIIVDWWRRRVDVLEASYPRLPDAYYGIGPEIPAGEPIDFDSIVLPDLEPWQVSLERPAVLGVDASRVDFRLDVDERRISLENVRVAFHDRDKKMGFAGFLVVDFDTKKVTGRVDGAAAHAQIAPVIDVLDFPVAQPYVAAFSDLSGVVPATITWEGGLEEGSIDLRFFIDVPRCKYEGVALEMVKGSIVIKGKPDASRDPEDDFLYAVTIKVDEGVDRDGRRLAGSLTITNEEGPIRLKFGAGSDLKFDDLLAIINVFDKDLFDFMTFDAPPIVVARGSSGTDPSDLDGYDLKGTLRLKHGSFLGLTLNDVAADIALKGDTLTTKGTAIGKTGGRFMWRNTDSFAGFGDGEMRFTLDADCRGASVEELAELFTFDLGERNGTVDGEVSLSGAIGTNVVETLNGKGSVRVTDGKLAQMKLFAGLTEILADTVPGVSYLVNQSQASADFTFENGVFKSENVLIEGGLISISGRGTYDCVADALDFTVYVRLFKKNSFVGKLVQPLTAPIAWTLLEFKLTGPLDEPVWRRTTFSEMLFKRET